MAVGQKVAEVGKKAVKKGKIQGTKEVSTTLAKKLPHRHTSLFLYRDYLRVIRKKYKSPLASRMRSHVRQGFEANRYLGDKERMETVEEGVKFLGLLSCQEGMFNESLKDPDNYLKCTADRHEFQSNIMDRKLIHIYPYVFLQDLWERFGLDEYGQTTVWLRTHNEAERLNNEYNEKKKPGRDAAREWLMKRLQLIEHHGQSRRVAEHEMQTEERRAEDDDKVERLYQHIQKSRDDGRVSYKDVHMWCEKVCRKQEDFHMSFDSWCYACDLMGIKDYYGGMDLNQFRKLYIDHGFFNLDYQHECIENLEQAHERVGWRVYNTGAWQSLPHNVHPLFIQPQIAMLHFVQECQKLDLTEVYEPEPDLDGELIDFYSEGGVHHSHPQFFMRESLMTYGVDDVGLDKLRQYLTDYDMPAEGLTKAELVDAVESHIYKEFEGELWDYTNRRFVANPRNYEMHSVL